MEKKQIKIVFDTNFNNKLDCTAFIHVGLAPAKKPLLSELDNMLIEIATQDHTHAPVTAEIKDLLIVPYKQISDLVAYCSHGISAYELKFKLQQKIEGFSWDTPVAVYSYKKYMLKQRSKQSLEIDFNISKDIAE